MKTIFNKFTAVLLSGVLITPGMTIAKAEENTKGSVMWNFEDGTTQGWTLGSGQGGNKNNALSVQEEDDNKFLRLETIETGAYYSAGYKAANAPDAYVNTNYVFPENGSVVISQDVRYSDTTLNGGGTPTVNFYKQFLVNFYEDEVPQNNGSVNMPWAIRGDNKLFYTYSKTSSNDAFTTGSGWKQGQGVNSNYVTSADTWYTVKAIFNTDGSGTAKTVSYYLYSDKGELIYSICDEQITHPNLKIKEIADLSIALLRTKDEKIPNSTYDIDNVFIYEIKEEYGAELISENKGNIYFNADSVEIKFNAEINPETVNEENIKVFYGDSEIPYNGTYIPGEMKYILEFSETLPQGEYTVMFEQDKIYGLDKEAEYSVPVSTSELSFKAFAGAVPTAENVELLGNAGAGNKLIAKYEYYNETGIEGTVNLKWYYSYDGEEFDEIEGQISDSYVISEEYADCYIMFKAFPVRNDGIEGDAVKSNVLAPPLPPVAENLKIKGSLVAGGIVEAEYDFTDENEDNNSGSKIQWYISDSEKGAFEKLADGTRNKYIISDDMIGKYLMFEVTPIADKAPEIGKTVESEAFGPITDSVDDNLYAKLDPGFENGTTEYWSITTYTDATTGLRNPITIGVSDKEARTGKYSLTVTERTVNTSALNLIKKIAYKADTTYIHSAWVKLFDSASKDTIPFSYNGIPGKSMLSDAEKQYTANKNEWTEVFGLSYVTVDSNSGPHPTCWPSGLTGYDFYIDDLYSAPLIIADIDVRYPESIQIPVSGEVSEELVTGNIKNQLGNSLGLKNETAFWRVEDNAKGVYVDGDRLVVTEDAVAGTIWLEAVVEPSFKGAVQESYVKICPVELVSNSVKTPQIRNLKLNGTVKNGAKLQVEYDFYQVDGEENCSTVEWYVSDSANGTYTRVDGASDESFTITPEYVGKFFMVKVTPKTADKEGTAVSSNKACPPTAPAVKNVSINGVALVDEVLTVSYDFSDDNSDQEATSEYQWYRKDSNGEFVKIQGAEGSEYILTDEDVNSSIIVEVTPVSENEPNKGAAVRSGEFKGPVPPVAKQLSITQQGRRFSGKYVYSQEAKAPEGESVLVWYLDGKQVGTGLSCDISIKGRHTITFEVTPVSERKPMIGETVSVSKQVSSGSSGGSSGGGGGGSVSISPSVTIPPVGSVVVRPGNETDITLPSGLVSDMNGHWALNFAEKVVEKNIMGTDSGKKFNPEKILTRREILEYLFKVTGWSEAEYQNEFSDVLDSDSFAGILQAFVNNGVISHDTKFRPDANMTREEFCKVLALTLKNNTEVNVDLTKYADYSDFSEWAIPYIMSAVSNSFLTGVSETRFSPKTNISKAQLAKIIVYILDGNYVVEEGGNKTENQGSADLSKYDGSQSKIDTSGNEFTVAFIGGSHVQLGSEWQNAVVKLLEQKMPGKKINAINAGVGGTTSAFGAIRYQRDVLSYKPDMVCIEFARNDHSFDEQSSKEFMDSMVNQSLNADKVPAIFFLYAVSPQEYITNGDIKGHNQFKWKQEVADYYGIPSVNVLDYMLADYEAMRKDMGEYSIDQYFSNYYVSNANGYDVHGGYVKYGEAIVAAMNSDFESFMLKPKNLKPFCDVNLSSDAGSKTYRFIPSTSESISYTGEWDEYLKHTSIMDTNAAIPERFFKTNPDGIVQLEYKAGEFEFETDAAQICFEYIASLAGNTCKVYVDGEEKLEKSTYFVSGRYRFSSPFVDIPQDGKKHKVKIVVNEPTDTSYVFTLNGIYEVIYK